MYIIAMFESENENVDRRTILKSVGTGAALIGGLSSVSAARTDSGIGAELDKSRRMTRAVDPFTDRHTVEQALIDHSTKVREQLANKGVSVAPSHDEFDEVRTFPDYEDGIATAHIVAELEDTTRSVELHVLPQAGRSFAFVETESNTRRLKVEDGELKPTVFCETSTYCDGYCQCSATQPCGTDCDAGYEVTEECCTYSDGSTSCEVKDRTCTSSCPGNDDCD